jgi:hypothetical protein
MNRTLANAVRAGTAARLAAAAARRFQIAQMRGALDMRKAQNQHHRQQVSEALARLSRGCKEFRRQLRSKVGRTCSPTK